MKALIAFLELVNMDDFRLKEEAMMQVGVGQEGGLLPQTLLNQSL